MAEPRASGPSRKEWERWKPVIKQLYIDDARPLSCVMVKWCPCAVFPGDSLRLLTSTQDIMAKDHNFVAPYGPSSLTQSFASSPVFFFSFFPCPGGH